MNYNEAYNLIIEAYFKDEIKPYNGNFCFCGTLAKLRPHNEGWETSNYNKRELNKMEFALLSTIDEQTFDEGDMYYSREKDVERLRVISHPNYEDALFAGMSAALDVLKQIHIERGEVIDPTPSFTKRQLANS